MKDTQFRNMTCMLKTKNIRNTKPDLTELEFYIGGEWNNFDLRLINIRYAINKKDAHMSYIIVHKQWEVIKTKIYD